MRTRRALRSLLAVAALTMGCGDNPAAPSPPKCTTVYRALTPTIACGFHGCKIVDEGPLTAVKIPEGCVD